jgi:acyl carrier protein
MVCEMIDGLSYGSIAEWDDARKRAALMDLGIDSLDAVKLVQSLNARLEPALSLSKTVIFECPSVRDLAAHIRDELSQEAAVAPSAFPLTARHPALHTPNGSSVLRVATCELWRTSSALSATSLLPAGGDSVGQIPSCRWDLLSPRGAASFGSFMPDVQMFDCAIFCMSHAETVATDPQHRLLLEAGYVALHGVHHRRSSLRTADVGIFLGIMNADFAALYTKVDSVYAATGGTLSIAAGRLSLFSASKGPASALTPHAHRPTSRCTEPHLPSIRTSAPQLSPSLSASCCRLLLMSSTPGLVCSPSTAAARRLMRAPTAMLAVRALGLSSWDSIVPM